MDKNKLYLFSLEIRKILNTQNISVAEQKIKQSNLSQEEIDFLFMCLYSDGYDSKSGRFVEYESDNSEFLKLVNIVKNQITASKKEK